jgi:hypothetical protein
MNERMRCFRPEIALLAGFCGRTFILDRQRQGNLIDCSLVSWLSTCRMQQMGSCLSAAGTSILHVLRLVVLVDVVVHKLGDQSFCHGTQRLLLSIHLHFQCRVFNGLACGSVHTPVRQHQFGSDERLVSQHMYPNSKVNRDLISSCCEL